MKKQIVVKIENDYNSTLSYDIRNEDIKYLLSEIDLYCEVSNSNFINIVKELQPIKTYKENYKKSLIVNATGYSQGDWQEYKLYYNDDINKDFLNNLVNLLEKSFTHQNDYIAYVNELITINGKTYSSNNTECYGFCITNIEFPDDEDVIKEFKNQYDIDYDKIEINID